MTGVQTCALPICWAVAAGLVPEVLELLARTPEGTVLTLNVPDLPADQLGELRVATLATKGKVEFRVHNLDDDQIGVHSITPPGTAEPGSDVALLSAGHPTLTAVRSVGEDAGLPLADLLSRR